MKGILIFWLVFSLISALIFARYSKGLCAYLFTSLAWIFIWTLIIQTWDMNQNEPLEIGMLVVASLTGWIIGTFLIWRKLSPTRGFYYD